VDQKLDCYHCFLRVDNFATANSRPTEVYDASKRTCKTVISEKNTCKVNKIKDLDFVCVIVHLDMSSVLPGTIVLND